MYFLEDKEELARKKKSKASNKVKNISKELFLKHAGVTSMDSV